MIINRLSILIFGLCLCGQANADQESPFYWGLKGGRVYTSAFEYIGAGRPAVNAGGFFGWRFNRSNNLSLEAEATTSIRQGNDDNDCISLSPTSCDGDYDFTQYAAYVVWRTGDSVYFKGKLGYSVNDYDGTASISIDDNVNKNDDAVSWGLGVGFAERFEIDFTRLNDTVLFVSFGYRF